MKGIPFVYVHGFLKHIHAAGPAGLGSGLFLGLWVHCLGTVRSDGDHAGVEVWPNKVACTGFDRSGCIF